jgi:hypothetical protein
MLLNNKIKISMFPHFILFFLYPLATITLAMLLAPPF